jgi:hypothetical protein
MEWLPPDNELSLNVAVPLAFREAEPITVLPSRKLSCPVPPAGVTVAVNVTDCP